MTTVRVEFGTIEDTRRVIFESLDAVADARLRARLANALTSSLRNAGLLAQAVEQHYNLRQVCQLTGRCDKYVKAQAMAGKFGTVMRDDGGWLIPASGVQRWLEARVFSGSVASQPNEVAA